jgi:hypothetical protein
MHDEFPTRPEHWAKHLEGSYADREQLRTLDGLGHNWLYIDHGWREMQWATHCNTEVVRWTLRECGVTLAGPAPQPLVDEVPAEALRDRMRRDVVTLLPELATWSSLELAWGQRYAVTTLCRMLYTLDTAMVCSKLPANSVQGWQVADGTLYASDIHPDVVKWFLGGLYNNSVSGATIKDGSLSKADLNAAAKAELALGKGSVSSIFEESKVIATIGGKFASITTVLASN